MKATLISLAAAFAVFGTACNIIDGRDVITVPNTAPVDGMIVEPNAERLTINEAKRELDVVVDSTGRWVEWRSEDIAKREQWVSFAEGVSSSGFDALIGEAAAFAGPFAPLVTLLGGYSIKRRKDRTPDEVAQEKRDSYNKGVEVGKAMALAIKGETPES